MLDSAPQDAHKRLMARERDVGREETDCEAAEKAAVRAVALSGKDTGNISPTSMAPSRHPQVSSPHAGTICFSPGA